MMNMIQLQPTFVASTGLHGLTILYLAIAALIWALVIVVTTMVAFLWNTYPRSDLQIGREDDGEPRASAIPWGLVGKSSVLAGLVAASLAALPAVIGAYTHNPVDSHAFTRFCWRNQEHFFILAGQLFVTVAAARHAWGLIRRSRFDWRARASWGPVIVAACSSILASAVYWSLGLATGRYWDLLVFGGLYVTGGGLTFGFFMRLIFAAANPVPRSWLTPNTAVLLLVLCLGELAILLLAVFWSI